MTDSSKTTTPTTPEQELAALVAQFSDLTKLAVAMTQHCVHLQERLPAVVAMHVDALKARAMEFEQGTTVTPDELESRFPPGVGDNATWYVVIVGREPGMYLSSTEADDQVKGVPNMSRLKKSSRREALDFYRHQYNHHEVMKLTEVYEEEPVAAPVASLPPRASASGSRRYSSAIKVTVTIG
ncbi:hypothetical protein B0H16DRAFT_1746581 [Mycena metata]|uniref:Ribonuclease H1 N-terminal domain-containing protein n=1 Tax=Mycena metata TaxID=1033252 RepID=A0AAD7GXD5_9AGAR|nr:hypothetical protein B0H16DRAFT_1746581 [Mycena metata]